MSAQRFESRCEDICFAQLLRKQVQEEEASTTYTRSSSNYLNLASSWMAASKLTCFATSHDWECCSALEQCALE